MLQNIEWGRVTWYSQLIAVILFVGVFALGFYLGGQYTAATYEVSTIATTTPAVATSTSPISTDTTVSQQKPRPANELRLTAYLTAYTYWDNTPPGSSEISNPIVHDYAGGTGTYQDPITVAVGHSITNGVDTLDYPAGTKFYIPNLRRYFIVEDTCGDGDTPQNGPCHTGYEGHPWLDLWLGGAGGDKDTTDACANAITDLHLVIKNPASDYAVVSGPIFGNACAAQYGDTPVII